VFGNGNPWNRGEIEADSREKDLKRYGSRIEKKHINTRGALSDE
jgi:hypothetical protein